MSDYGPLFLCLKSYFHIHYNASICEYGMKRVYMNIIRIPTETLSIQSCFSVKAT